MKKTFFSTKALVGTALFSAIAYGISFLEFPIFGATPFLKLDFSAVFITLSGFLFGPVAGICSAFVKEGLRFITGLSSTGGIGELANFIMVTAFILIPTLIYKFKKGIPVVIIGLCSGVIVATGVSLLVNRFINFPLYMGDGASGFFDKVWYFILFFNLIKWTAIGVLTFVLYKPLSRTFKGEYFNKKKTDGNALNGQSDGGVLISKSEQETERIGKDYAKTLNAGDVVLLSGELGAGKTAFVRGVADYFGYGGVTSPTYAYLNIYGDYIYHYDCYRLSSGEDALNLGLTDYFGKNNICFIEWSENIESVLPESCKRVTIEKLGENERKITVL